LKAIISVGDIIFKIINFPLNKAYAAVIIYAKDNMAGWGDQLKKLILIMALLCIASLGLNAAEAQRTNSAADIAAKAPTQTAAQAGTALYSYASNLSSTTVNFISTASLFNIGSYFAAETVKFTAPKAGWKLNRVEIIGWDGYNGTAASAPAQQIIAMEIRDKDLNLLYRFNDIQWPYTNFVLNITRPMPISIDLPSIPVSGDFYICFYDRGAVLVGTEVGNATGNSYFYDAVSREIIPAVLPTNDNQTVSVNWIMRAYGQ
jgi:hypothetical protein